MDTETNRLRSEDEQADESVARDGDAKPDGVLDEAVRDASASDASASDETLHGCKCSGEESEAADHDSTDTGNDEPEKCKSQASELDDSISDSDASDSNASESNTPGDNAPQDNVSDDNASDDDPSDGTASDDNTSDNDEPSDKERIATLTDELARARADMYNLNKEYTNFVKRSKASASGHFKRGQSTVLDTLIPVLDDIYAARQAGDLEEGPFAAIAEKLENTLETNFQLQRFGEEGEEFNPELHDAMMAHDSEDVTVATIAQVLQPGYKSKDTVLRPTKVIVNNPA